MWDALDVVEFITAHEHLFIGIAFAHRLHVRLDLVRVLLLHEVFKVDADGERANGHDCVGKVHCVWRRFVPEDT